MYICGMISTTLTARGFASHQTFSLPKKNRAPIEIVNVRVNQHNSASLVYASMHSGMAELPELKIRFQAFPRAGMENSLERYILWIIEVISCGLRLRFDAVYCWHYISFSTTSDNNHQYLNRDSWAYTMACSLATWTSLMLDTFI